MRKSSRHLKREPILNKTLTIEMLKQNMVQYHLSGPQFHLHLQPHKDLTSA